MHVGSGGGLPLLGLARQGFHRERGTAGRENLISER